MAKKITQKQLKHDEFVDAAFDFGHWLEEHWVQVAASIAVATVVAVGFVAWKAWARHGEERAAVRLAQAIDRYEQAEDSGFVDRESLDAALETFDDVSAAVGDGPGRVARFYRGATMFHLDRLDEARADLERVVADSGVSDTLGASAQLLLAQVEVTAGRTDEAVALLQGLADQPDAAVPPGEALLELGRIQQLAGHSDEARRQWQRVVDEYPQSVAASEANSLLQ
jgi:predicted negative regulator of RcsB-dependent stress response